MSLILTPEHRQDLERSGLTTHTIERLRLTAVSPNVLHRQLAQAESAYVIPYFHLDGTPNKFARWKMVPEVPTDHGLMKYWQPPETRPHLYIAPLMDWPAIAQNRQAVITFIEGEKKAARACQDGLAALGIGGIWNWSSLLANGDRLVLPELDDFLWRERPVLMTPDSDAWRNTDKGRQIFQGFFALAKMLQHLGAVVQFVRLPDIHGKKAGIDDWLMVPGTTIEHSWPHLERIRLDDSFFASLTAWWQNREARLTTTQTLTQQTLNHLEINEAAGLYTIRSAAHHVTLMFDRLADQRSGVDAELSVILGTTELLADVDLSLKSDTGQTKLAASLRVTAPSVPWKLLLQKACALVLKRYRQGEPSQRLTRETVVEPLSYAVNPFVHERKSTILFADGGTGKSTLGLLCAMLVSVGGSVAGISARQGKALYLDYEDDADTHARRMHAIQAGHPELLAAELDYQRCTESLPNMVHTLLRKIQADGITFLVIDSLVAAAGGSADLDAIGQFFAALRILNVTTLVIGHVPKPQSGEESTKSTVYGSVFSQNYCRMLWEVRKDQQAGEDTSTLTLSNPKSNHARIHPPFGLTVTQNSENTSIRYDLFDLSQSAVLEAVIPMANRIRNLLEDGLPRSSQAIAEALAANLASVKVTLSRHRDTKWHMIGENHEAQWTVLHS